MPDLLLKYGVGKDVLEIGSETGALASWLSGQGYQVSCIEPAEKLAEQAQRKGLKVYPAAIQDFKTDHQYDNVVAISSLIHLPKVELSQQIQKISRLLKPHGIFFVSLLEGEDEGFEDPTHIGRMRYFSKWKEKELDSLLSQHFDLLEGQKVNCRKLDQTLFLNVYAAK